MLFTHKNQVGFILPECNIAATEESYRYLGIMQANGNHEEATGIAATAKYLPRVRQVLRRISSWYLMAARVPSSILYRSVCPSMDMPTQTNQPTTKRITLNNVAGSITYTAASPEPFSCFTRAQSEPCCYHCPRRLQKLWSSENHPQIPPVFLFHLQGKQLFVCICLCCCL